MTASRLDFIHVFEPATAPGTRRRCCVLHGTGGNEHDLCRSAARSCPGAAFLSPRGKVLERGMPRFFRRLAEGVFDLEDLQAPDRRARDFVARCRRALRLRSAPRDRRRLFKRREHRRERCSCLRPGTLQAALLFSPMVPIVPDPLPDLHGVQGLHQRRPPDPLVAPANTQHLADAARASRRRRHVALDRRRPRSGRRRRRCCGGVAKG